MYYEVDWARRVDHDRCRELRRQALVREMQARGIDAIFTLKQENARYATGLRPLWFPIVRMRDGALIRKDGRAICLPSSGDCAHRKATMYWMDPADVRPLPALEDPEIIRKAMPMLKGLFAELEIEHARVGLDVTTEALHQALVKNFPGVEWVDGEACFRAAKLVKNEEEIKLMRIASACVDIGFDAVARAVAPGRRECEILGEGARAMYALGMETMQCASIVASGENLWPLARLASDRMIRNGEIVFVDMGGCFNGMFAEATRTIACGKPNADQKRIYRAVYDVLQAIVGAMKPGVTSQQVWDAAAAAYEKTGLAQYTIASSLGHSIGMGGWEAPNLGNPALSGEDFTLQPGMVFMIEPTLIVPGVPGGGAVRIEEVVLITETGSEILTRAPYDEQLLS